MTTTDAKTRSMLLTEVEVERNIRLSPHFARIVLSSADLEELGVDGPTLDQRIKLVFPGASGALPALPTDDTWYAHWRHLPEAERGHLRTYTIREIAGDGADTRLVVDFVLHEEPGHTGPGSAWAATATPGDRILLVGPRKGVPFGGIEFDPGSATRVLVAGDETAAPAICAILEHWPAGVPGTAIIEVPEPADRLQVCAPPQVEVQWLSRSGRQHGDLLRPAVLAALGLQPADPASAHAPSTPSTPGVVDVDGIDLWETPTYSASGEETTPDTDAAAYSWIAGEAGVVMGLRRELLASGLHRSHLACMGYWRQGRTLG